MFDVGAAFARLLRENKRRCHQGRGRLRHAGKLAHARGGVRLRRDRPGPRRRPHRAGLDRPAVLRVRIPRLPRRDVHGQPQPRRLQRDQAVPGRRQAGRSRHRARRHRRRRDRRRADLRRAGRARSPTATCSPTTAQFLRSLVNLTGMRPLRVVVDAGNGMAGHTAPAVLGPIESITMEPLYFELDGTFPNHEANPLDPANLVDLQNRVRATGADIGLGVRRRRRPVFRDRRARRAGVTVDGHGVGGLSRTQARDRCHRDPQPDHVARGARVGDRARWKTAVRSRVGHSYIKALMARRARSSAASILRTTTSATSGARTPGCSLRCTCCRRSANRIGHCRS